jgi:hypothetical protein
MHFEALETSFKALATGFGALELSFEADFGRSRLVLSRVAAGHGWQDPIQSVGVLARPARPQPACSPDPRLEWVCWVCLQGYFWYYIYFDLVCVCSFLFFAFLLK